MKRNFLLFLATALFSGCGGQTLQIYNETGQTWKSTVGSQTVNQCNEVLHESRSVGRSKGTKS